MKVKNHGKKWLNIEFNEKQKRLSGKRFPTIRIGRHKVQINRFNKTPYLKIVVGP